MKTFVLCSLFACGTDAVQLGGNVIEQEASAWCSPANPPDTYDFFSTSGPYVSGPASAALPWRGETFDYASGATIECSGSRGTQSHLEVTSGCLLARQVSVYPRGFTNDYNMRALAVGTANGARIKWTDQVAEVRANINLWQEGAPDTAGVHLFARYRTENDLYVASYRKDGNVTIKRKRCGEYLPLVTRFVGIPAQSRWYRLRFAAVGSQLTFSIDDVVQATATDTTFSWGTTGLRTDYADVYLDDWKLIY